MPVEDAPDGACESVVVQEGQFRPLAYVDHDGFLSDGPIPSSSRSHAPGFFAADIFFEDEKTDIGWDACGRDAPFDIGKELKCVL